MTAPKTWSPEQKKLISQLMERETLTRMQAVRRVSAGKTNITAKLPSVAALKKASRKVVKAVTKAVALKDNYKPGPALREKIDALVIKTLRDQFGEVCPILGSLGQRYMSPSTKNGYPYERLLARTPKGLYAVFIGGIHNGNPIVSIVPAVKSSYTVERLLDRLARKEKSASKEAQ